MKTKNSKAQIEVWKWKEEASKELSNLSYKDVIGYIKGKVAETKEQIVKAQDKMYKNKVDDIGFVADK